MIQAVKWYYSNQKEAEGPVSENILRHLIEAGVLPGDTLIWREGEDTWQPAHQKLADLNLDPFHPPNDPEKNVAELNPVDPEAEDWRPVIGTDSEPPVVPLYSEDNHETATSIMGAVLASVAVVGVLTVIGRSCG